MNYDDKNNNNYNNNNNHCNSNSNITILEIIIKPYNARPQEVVMKSIRRIADRMELYIALK